MLFRKDINGDIKPFTPIKPRKNLWHRDMLYIPKEIATLEYAFMNAIEQYKSDLDELSKRVLVYQCSLRDDFNSKVERINHAIESLQSTPPYPKDNPTQHNA